MSRSKKPVQFMGRIKLDPLRPGKRRRRRSRLLATLSGGVTTFADKALPGPSGLEKNAAVLKAAEQSYGRHLIDDFDRALSVLCTTNQIGMLIDSISDKLRRLSPPIILDVEGQFKDPDNPAMTFQAFIVKLHKDNTLGDLVAAITVLAHY